MIACIAMARDCAHAPLVAGGAAGVNESCAAICGAAPRHQRGRVAAAAMIVQQLVTLTGVDKCESITAGLHVAATPTLQQQQQQQKNAKQSNAPLAGAACTCHVGSSCQISSSAQQCARLRQRVKKITRQSERERVREREGAARSRMAADHTALNQQQCSRRRRRRRCSHLSALSHLTA